MTFGARPLVSQGRAAHVPGMSRLSLLLVVLVAACDGPLEVGRPLPLGRINGQPLPWASPGDTMVRPLKIAEGWILVHDNGLAERHERVERWVLNSPTDSTLLFSEWTQGGAYQWMPGRIVITYPFWSYGSGPASPVETLFVSDGALTLREVGYLPPLDSMVRRYCSQPC